MAEVRVLGISGSLRSGSYNTQLLDHAIALAPPWMTIERYEGMRALPHYDGDLDADGPPAEVADLRARIAEAEALLLVSPEYNYSVPGVLKNLIDWASRPQGSSALRAKPTAILGATRGAFGTARAQLALRQILQSTDTPVVRHPQVLVPFAAKALASEGRVGDEITGPLSQLLEGLAVLVRRPA